MLGYAARDAGARFSVPNLTPHAPSSPCGSLSRDRPIPFTVKAARHPMRGLFQDHSAPVNPRFFSSALVVGIRPRKAV
jgi:hypothetical protein